MGVDSIFYLHGIYTPSGSLISQLADTTPAVTHERIIAYASGYPQPLFIGTRKQKIGITFTSTAIRQVLDLIAAGGNPYAVDLSAGNLDLLYVKAQDLGLRYDAAVLTHYRFRVTRGFMYWQSIKAAENAEATIDCRIVPTYDGANPPVIPAGSVALAGTPAVTQQFGLGPVKLNSSWIYGEQSWDLSLKETLKEASGGGELWDTFAGIQRIAPECSIRALGVPWKSVGLTGTAITDLRLYLRAKTPDGTSYADGEALHILATSLGGKIDPDNTRGGGENAAETTVLAQLRAVDSSSNALGFDTTSAIA